MEQEERPKIIYLHGFASSGATGTAQLLRLALPDYEIISPDIPLEPSEALPFLRNLCTEAQPILIVGTSMGGMYTQQMFGYRRLAINPAFWMSRLSKVLKIGTFTYLNKRKDKQMQGRVTKATIEAFRQMENQQFDGITSEDANLCYAIFGRHDSTVRGGYETFTEHYPEENAEWFDGEHRVNDEVLKKAVLPKIRQLLSYSR